LPRFCNYRAKESLSAQRRHACRGSVSCRDLGYSGWFAGSRSYLRIRAACCIIETAGARGKLSVHAEINYFFFVISDCYRDVGKCKNPCRFGACALLHKSASLVKFKILEIMECY
jgi:hypothetical protein